MVERDYNEHGPFQYTRSLSLFVSQYNINTLNTIQYINTTASAELNQHFSDRPKIQHNNLPAGLLCMCCSQHLSVFPSQSMDLSLQAIDFLFASSIQDGWPLSDMDCSADGIVGDDEGDKDGATFFRSHLSSRGLSGTLVGLDSERKTGVKLLHVEMLNTNLVFLQL